MSSNREKAIADVYRTARAKARLGGRPSEIVLTIDGPEVTAITNVPVIGNEPESLEIGVAKCRTDEDQFDYEIGAMLAVGRLYQKIGNRLVKRANGLVKHKDDMRQRKAGKGGFAKVFRKLGKVKEAVTRAG